MGRTIAILLGLVVVAGGGYYLWQSGTLDAATEGAADAVESASDTVEDTEAAGEGVLDAATDALEDAVDTATEAAGDAVEAATEGANDALEGAAEAAGDLLEGAGDAIGGVLEGLPAAGELANLLTPENFDADSILGLLEGIELPEGISDQITAAIESTRDNPDLIAGVIEQVRGLLGL